MRKFQVEIKIKILHHHIFIHSYCMYIDIPQMFLCQNFIPTNGVSLLSNKFKKRSTESQKSSKNI